MTTRFRTTIATGIAVLALAAGAPVFGQEQPSRRQGPGIEGRGGPGAPGMRGPVRRMGFGPLFRGVDLTDDQKAQLKKIAEARRSDFQSAGAKVRAAREGMRALVEADSVNESAIRAKSAEIAAAEAEVMILNAKMRQEALQVLTSEQQAKLKERVERRGDAKPRRPRAQQ